MSTTPDRTRIRLSDISSRAYEHPADRGALAALRKLKGFDEVVKQFFGMINMRSLRLMYLATAVRVDERQFPEVYDYLRDAAYVLDLEEIPELYIKQDTTPNAMAIGYKKPFIVMTTGLFDLLDAQEQRFVVGHEVGHILSGHALYRTMLLWLINLSMRIAFIPLGYIAISAIIAALQEWHRKSELSCDRAGLLACQDADAAKRALMKLAGGSRLAEMNTDAMLDQAREYDAGGDALDSVIKVLNIMGHTHPFPVIRLAELEHWVSSGAYQRILDGEYPRRETDDDTSLGDEARSAANSYRDAWQRSSDPLAGTLRDIADSAAGAGGRLFDNIAERWRTGGRGDENGGSGDSGDSGPSESSESR